MVYSMVKTHNKDSVICLLKAVDFETIGLLFGLFLIIGGISNMGVIDVLVWYL